jgi:hypothetical protein
VSKLAFLLAVGLAIVALPAVAASSTVRLEIVHALHGCHVWGTGDSQPLGPSRTIAVRKGTRLEIRVNCPMAFDFTQLAGPKLDLGDPRTYPGTVRAIVFARAGVYRLQAVNVQHSEDVGLQTLGPDNTLVLTVRVR